jgi:hypothetical protein
MGRAIRTGGTKDVSALLCDTQEEGRAARPESKASAAPKEGRLRRETFGFSLLRRAARPESKASAAPTGARVG